MIHYYTFGKTAKRGLILTPELAHAYNRFTQSFLDAQFHYGVKYGRAWTPNKPISMPFGGKNQMRHERDLEKYHRFVEVSNKQYWIRNKILRRPIREDDVCSDFLVKKF